MFGTRLDLLRFLPPYRGGVIERQKMQKEYLNRKAREVLNREHYLAYSSKNHKALDAEELATKTLKQIQQERSKWWMRPIHLIWYLKTDKDAYRVLVEIFKILLGE